MVFASLVGDGRWEMGMRRLEVGRDEGCGMGFVFLRSE